MNYQMLGEMPGTDPSLEPAGGGGSKLDRRAAEPLAMPCATELALPADRGHVTASSDFYQSFFSSLLSPPTTQNAFSLP